MDKIRTAIIGVGKMGSIHAKICRQLPDVSLVALVDTDIEKARKLAQKYRCIALAEPAELLGKVDAVTIATPTASHLELAELFLANHIPVMIEKPLAADVEQAARIVALADKNNTLAAVGHSERCNPVVQAIKRLDIEPKFIEATRISPYPFRSTDIGVVLDVMIHDIDIILSLAQSPVINVDAVGVAVLDETEDICSARITFANGCIANVTASRLALKTERKVRVFSRQAYLSLDYFRKTGTIIRAAPNVNVVEKIRQLKLSGKLNLLKLNWNEMLKVENLDIDDVEPLRLEQQAFLGAVADKSRKPQATAQDGLAAMKCAEMILKSIKQHKW